MADCFTDVLHDTLGCPYVELLAWPVAGDPHRLMTIEPPDRRRLKKMGAIKPKGNA